MAGGTFLTQNKVRPGAYVNFKSEAKPLGTMSDRGIMTIPLVHSWGQEKKILLLEPSDDFIAKMGYGLYDQEMILLKEGFKRASKILVYRVSGGEKAKKVVAPLTVSANYVGKRGNAITVKIVADVDTPDTFIVTTLLGGRAVDQQVAKTIEQLVDNDFVTFDGTGVLVANVGIVLEGGTDTLPTTQDYADYFEELQVYEFNTMALPVEDPVTKGAAVSFIKRMREDEGKKCQGVLADYAGADYEGIISVKNGVKLMDGTIIDKVKATAWVAGATAGANVNESNTYSKYEEAVDVDVRYTNTEIIAALQKGEIIFVEKGGTAVVEQDINTYTSFKSDKNKDFRKNRVVRVLDAIGNDINTIFGKYYAGVQDNDKAGRNCVKAEIIKYIETLQGIGAVQNFDASKDIEVLPGEEKDATVVDLYVQPTDSMEKLYMTVTVR